MHLRTLTNHKREDHHGTHLPDEWHHLLHDVFAERNDDEQFLLENMELSQINN